jgi:ribosomal protein S12 methylthiotransferase
MSRSGPLPLSVATTSLGCPKNLVDTEVMLGLLQRAGFALVGEPEQADILLVNTCCFIGEARREAAEAIEEAIVWRRRPRARALLVAGCWPQSDPYHLRQHFPEIDAMLGPDDVPRIVEIVNRALGGETGRLKPAPPGGLEGGIGRLKPAPPATPSYLYDETTPRLRTTPPWTAYLKIAEGCRHRCRFCVIPTLRGAYRSRRLESVVAEATALAADGVREINLIAQDTSAYGRDTGEADTAGLLTRLAQIDGLHWIRMLYGYPTSITPRLIETMASQAAVCDYLDIPFQHADRAVLRRMGRPGEGEAYLELIARLRAAMPDIAIRSAFIVGYPGETEGEFQRLLAFLEAAQLDRAGAFTYSPEAGTPAAGLPDQVPAEIAEERYHRFMTAQQGISLARNRRWVGRDIEVLVEARREQGGWAGRSFRDAPEIDGLVLLRPGRRSLRPGEFVTARITGAEPYDLVGRGRARG